MNDMTKGWIKYVISIVVPIIELWVIFYIGNDIYDTWMIVPFIITSIAVLVISIYLLTLWRGIKL